MTTQTPDRSFAADAVDALQRIAWQTAEDHGWHDAELGMTVGDRIALMHSELSEALEAYRECGDVNKEWFRPEDGKPEGVGFELADTVIRIFDFCGVHGISLSACLIRKMAFNDTRPMRHGGKHL